MFRLTRAQVQPIGLDIGFDSIKMLQVEVVGEGLNVVAAARQAFPEEVKEQPNLRMPMAVDMIRSMFRGRGFCGRNVIASLPREIVHVKNIRLPQIPANELESAVSFEAKSLFSFDTDAARVNFLPAGEVRQGNEVRQEVITLAVKNEDVENHLEQLHHSGAIVESLDIEQCALFRTIERFIRRREDEQEVYVLVDVGSRASQVIIGKGREISFIKTIDIGGRQFQGIVSRKLGISMEEAQSLRRRLAETRAEVVGEAQPKRDPVRQAVIDATRSAMEELGREISLCLRYYSVTFRGQRPSKLRLIGGESGDPQLVAALNASLTIPVEAGRPLTNLDTSRMKESERRGAVGEWSLALGLSLKFTKGKFANREGKPRDPNAPREPAPAAEVVDLHKAVAAAETATAVAGVTHA